MPHPLFAHLTEQSDNTTSTRQPFSTPLTLLILLLSILTVFIALVPLFRLDFEVVLFLRSIHIQAVEEVGRIGNRLGGGVTLVLISVGLGVIGYVWNSDRFKRAGWQSLIAHGIAGLIIQTIKHLLGRPRPRFMHQDQWEMGPSFQGGLDTFPSGHSAASFAVAAVLARHFPKGSWVWYGAAAFVAASRIMRGSHFPSDAIAGSLIGFLVGYILSRPLKNWLMSLLDSIIQALPYWVCGFAAIWIIFHFNQNGPLQAGMFWMGLTMIFLAFGIRMFLIFNPRDPTPGYPLSIPTTNLMAGLGLALFTESLLVVLLATLSCLAWWVGHSHRNIAETRTDQGAPVKATHLAQEACIGLAVLALLFCVQGMKGLIPLQ